MTALFAVLAGVCGLAALDKLRRRATRVSRWIDAVLADELRPAEGLTVAELCERHVIHR